MATATKTPAKRATSQTNAAAAAKSTRTSARTGGSAVKKASSKTTGGAAKTGARTAAGVATAAAAGTTGTAKKAAVKRALNGASAHAPVATRAKPSRAKSNGALPAELAGDVQELARDTHEGEVVRKTRASSSAGGEAASGRLKLPANPDRYPVLPH